MLGKRRYIRRLCTLCIVLLLCGLIYTPFDIWLFSLEDQKTPADAIIVLGAGIQNDQPSPVFAQRLNHAVWLYQNGYGQHIILTGGYTRGNTRSDADTARQYILARGIPVEDIFIEERSVITEQNLEYAAQIAAQQGFTKVILVSDPLHMRRAMLMAQDYGLQAVSSPTPTTMFRSFWAKAAFTARESFYYAGYRVVRIFRGVF